MSETRCSPGRRASFGSGRFWCLVLTFALLGCRESAQQAAERAREAADAAPPWAPRAKEPTPPRGMVWIPEGALIAGTPPGRVPRLADVEMPGEQLVLHGFFIDQFAFPNEEGAIPQTGVSQARAEAQCKERGKRLCSELEWERACKGPRNFTYEYGDRYRPEVCLTGRAPRMLPSGYRTACRSEFGARDLHGGVWEWTMSRWGRGNAAELFSLRGGNSASGELVGRCTNAMGKAPETISAEIGFRCCKGEVNEAKVSLHVERGKPLEQRSRLEDALEQQLEALLPADVRQTLAAEGRFRPTSAWDWRPLGNVPLVVVTGCAGEAPSRRCGLFVAEIAPGASQVLAWVWVGMVPPWPRASKWDARRLWVTGGDRQSYFRQAVLYEWGRVRAAELMRKIPKEPD